MNWIFRMLTLALSSTLACAAPSPAPASNLPYEELENLELGELEPQLKLDPVPGPLPTAASLGFPFPLDERYTFEVRHETAISSVVGGDCSMELLGLHRVAGYWAIKFRLSAKSAKWYDWIYTLEDSVEGYFDAKTFKVLYLTMSKRENSYRQEKEIQFDYEKKLIIEKDSTKKKTKYAQYRLLDSVVDGYAVVYLIRSMDLANTKRIDYKVYSAGRIYPFHASNQGRYEIDFYKQMKKPYKIEVLTKVEGALEQKGGIFFYFSDDPLRAMLQMKGDVKIGKFHALLKDSQPRVIPL